MASSAAYLAALRSQIRVGIKEENVVSLAVAIGLLLREGEEPPASAWDALRHHTEEDVGQLLKELKGVLAVLLRPLLDQEERAEDLDQFSEVCAGLCALNAVGPVKAACERLLVAIRANPTQYPMPHGAPPTLGEPMRVIWDALTGAE